MGNGIVIFDLDDVLVDFSSLLYRNIRENWRIYNRWFEDKGDLTQEELQERNVYRLNEWLIKNKFRTLTSGQYTSLMKLIEGTMAKTFYSQDPYAHAIPNKFAIKTLLNGNYINNPSIKKVYILSRNATPGQAASKMNFIEKYFKHPKIEYIGLGMGSKGEYLASRNIDFDLFIDDEIPNIRAIIETSKDLNRKEFLIPEYGYNKLPPELDILIRERGATVSYFKI